MKSFFKKANHDIKKSFSKESRGNALRKFGKTLQTAGPIIEKGGNIVGGLAPVAAAVLPAPLGVPVAMGMKATQAGAKVTNQIYQMGGNAAVRDGRKMAPNHHSIQAPKPSDNGPDNVFY